MKRILTVILLCLSTIVCEAQYYDNPSVPLPTTDLYDTGVMNMYMNAARETYAARSQQYERYVGWAFEAASKEQWPYVIHYVTSALNTGFWNADLYFLRGRAYEQLKQWRYAKRDYKKGKRNGSSAAAEALLRLNMKLKQKR